MTALVDFVDAIPFAEKLQIFKDNEEFRSTGVTGDTTLRIKTQEHLDLTHSNGKKADGAWMTILANEVNRYIAKRVIDTIGMLQGQSLEIVKIEKTKG